MEVLEYKKKMEILQDDFESEKRKLSIKFALESAIFKIGDTIKDERWSFIIDKITAYIGHTSIPEPIYHGFELKKDGTQKKNAKRVTIYGNNAILIKKD